MRKAEIVSVRMRRPGDKIPPGAIGTAIGNSVTVNMATDGSIRDERGRFVNGEKHIELLRKQQED